MHDAARSAARRPAAPASTSSRWKRGLLVLVLPAVTLAGGPRVQGPGKCVPAVRAAIESGYRRWLDLVARRGSMTDGVFNAEADSLIAGLVALDVLARKVHRQAWDTLAPPRRADFESALGALLRRQLVSYFEKRGTGAAPALRYVREVTKSSATELEYSLETSGGQEKLRFEVTESPAGSCRIGDVEYNRRDLARSYRRRVLRLLARYSFPYMVAELGDRPYVVLEDFETSQEGELPTGWSWKKSDEDKRKPYRVRVEDGNKYLAARDEGESVILGKDIKWNLDEYPYVSFRWRIHEIPEGGDERYDDKVDSAAGIYFVYRKKLGLVPEAVKYVWSSTLPVGSAVLRKGTGKPWQIVVGSGAEGLGEWHTYVFDLRQAYRDTFGGEPPSRAIGIAILSDANSTHSHAYADYDDIRALREAGPEVGSGVKRILEPGSRGG